MVLVSRNLVTDSVVFVSVLFALFLANFSAALTSLTKLCVLFTGIRQGFRPQPQCESMGQPHV